MISLDQKRISMPGSPFGVVRGFVYGYSGIRADVFMPQMRELGAGLVRLFLWWGQIEPERGRFVWDAVETFLDQLETSDDVWVMLGSSSLWATRRSTELLPVSPAQDLDDYYRFVHALVTHCSGRVRYWQMDNEPHNHELFWSGTAQEYVDQLKVFQRAVKDADPDALVILGGAVGLFDPAHQDPGEQVERDFFDLVMREGADSYDVFDLHLYGDPYTIPAEVDYLRQKMAALGYQKPIFAGEYNGPMFFAFAENLPCARIFGDTLSAISSEDEQVQAERDQAEQAALKDLYACMKTLPPQTQMFMQDCPPEWEQKRHRINCRDLVMRNLLALSTGIQKTFCWNLATEKDEPYHLLHLMFDKFKIMEYEDGVVKKRYPAAETLNLLMEAMAGVELVRRIELPERPDLYLFEVQRREREPLFVIWKRGDAFSGEDEPSESFELPWHEPRAKAFDAFGQHIPVAMHENHLSLNISITPVFIETH